MTNKKSLDCFSITKMQVLPPSPQPRTLAPPAQSPEPQTQSPSPSPQPPEAQQSAQVGVWYLSSHRHFYITWHAKVSQGVTVFCGCLCQAEDEEVFEEIRRLRLERGRLLQKIKALEQQQQSAISALEEVLHKKKKICICVETCICVSLWRLRVSFSNPSVCLHVNCSCPN